MTPGAMIPEHVIDGLLERYEKIAPQVGYLGKMSLCCEMLGDLAEFVSPIRSKTMDSYCVALDQFQHEDTFDRCIGSLARAARATMPLAHTMPRRIQDFVGKVLLEVRSWLLPEDRTRVRRNAGWCLFCQHGLAVLMWLSHQWRKLHCGKNLQARARFNLKWMGRLEAQELLLTNVIPQRVCHWLEVQLCMPLMGWNMDCEKHSCSYVMMQESLSRPYETCEYVGYATLHGHESYQLGTAGALHRMWSHVVEIRKGSPKKKALCFAGGGGDAVAHAWPFQTGAGGIPAGAFCPITPPRGRPTLCRACCSSDALAALFKARDNAEPSLLPPSLLPPCQLLPLPPHPGRAFLTARYQVGIYSFLSR